jgi:ABC-type Mn2+/Zn2+ transport system permease subunit
VTTQLAKNMPGTGDPEQMAYASAAVGTAIVIIGLIASFKLPEPSADALPD